MLEEMDLSDEEVARRNREAAQRKADETAARVLEAAEAERQRKIQDEALRRQGR